MAERVRMGAHYGGDPRDRQGAGRGAGITEHCLIANGRLRIVWACLLRAGREYLGKKSGLG